MDLTFKNEFYVQNRSFRPKIDSRVNVINFQAEENFPFSQFLRNLDKERATSTPLIDQFHQNLVRACLKDEN